MLLLLSELLGIPGEFITQKEIPDILNNWLTVLLHYSINTARNHMPRYCQSGWFTIAKVGCDANPSRHNQKLALNSSIKNDVYFTVHNSVFPRLSTG